jgi:hypothetical protein
MSRLIEIRVIRSEGGMSGNRGTVLGYVITKVSGS